MAQHPSRFPLVLSLWLLALVPVNGCFLAVVGGAGAEAGYVAGQEDRTSGETVSDQWIHAKVKSALAANSRVKGRNINVDVRKGVVTLRGFATSAEEKAEAVETALKVRGVRKVKDKLSITP